MQIHARVVLLLAVECGAVLALAAPASATFHLAEISEIMTSYDASADAQFVEILMNASGQQFVAGTKLNVFDADGTFVATALTVPGNVASGTQRPWIMGTPAFEMLSGVTADFEFPNASLPTGGGMVCWGAPGNNPTPVSCNGTGVPYVDCIAYGSYSGPTNTCIGAPTPLAPDGHSLVRTDSSGDNRADFTCADPATPENNARETADLAATVPCATATTTTSTSSTTTPIPTTTSTTLAAPSCGDANSDGNLTASDALVALRTAVGSVACPSTLCDTDGSGSITASDALLILKVAVGQDVALACP